MPRFLVCGPPVRLCMGIACVLALSNAVPGLKGEHKQEKGTSFLPAAGSVLREEKKEEAMTFLAATELPAKSVDLSALNLTELVNGMLSRALKESKKFFSLLTVTSYSSFAFHKVSIAIYNISNPKTVDSAKFPTRYCYCLNNRTNDLSDFTALLVDIIGNSTSYLTEIFKSTSILSVSQTNESNCIFICVMAGRSGRNLSDFWEMAERSPVINYTFTSSVAMAGVLGSATRKTAETSRPTTQSRQTLRKASLPTWTQSSHGESAPRTFLWAETSSPSERQAVGGPARLIPTQATGTQRIASHSHPASATNTTTGINLPEPEENVLRYGEGDGNTTGDSRQPGTRFHVTSGQGSDHGEHTWRSPPDSPRPHTLGSSHGCPGGHRLGRVVGRVRQRHPAQSSRRNSHPCYTDSNPNQGTSPQRSPDGCCSCKMAAHPWGRARGCPRLPLKEGPTTAAPAPVVIQKLHPCLMELCHYFQRCLCGSHRRDSSLRTVRYCLESYSWFLKNATLICGRVKRVSHSHTLKQKCLENVCKSV
ncbi:HERV-H LTR-associating protein 1 [Perognathus longimembris pacificus]|uniref:HERV-H LTR-associating protein 1 n=1 Tax=Perognathus longimembris pacificus TaxID=214514 RepID=UPI002019707A|nr:HERV-H LTR-associating protein 1 [Perognathus longimembris pacificus]